MPDERFERVPIRKHMASTRSTDPCKVDEQGRTIIPKEVRDVLGLDGRGHVVYQVEGERVWLRRVEWTAR